VSLLARSGGGDVRTVVHTWRLNPLRTRWAWAMNLHRADELSDSGIYQLDDLHRMFSTTTGKITDMFTFSDQEGPDMEYARTVLVAEVFRILEHKQARHATEESDERIKNEIQSRFDGTDTFEGALAELRNLITEL